MATDLHAITNSKPLSSFSEQQLAKVLKKLKALNWKRFKCLRIVDDKEIWVEAQGEWKPEQDEEIKYPEIYYSSPYPMSFYLKENLGIVTFIYKYRLLYDISNNNEETVKFRKDLFDFISIFGGTEVCFLADNACDKLSKFLELQAFENSSYDIIKTGLINEFGKPVTDYKSLDYSSLNYRNITEFVFDDFKDLKNNLK
jgi:hypothetical protein